MLKLLFRFKEKVSLTPNTPEYDYRAEDFINSFVYRIFLHVYIL